MPSVLFVASIETTLRLFVAPLARELRSNGIDSIAVAGDVNTEIAGFSRTHTLAGFRRGSPAAVAMAYRQLKKVVEVERPTLIHLHTPPALVLGRLAARAARIPSIAVAHGSFLEPRGARSLAYGIVETILGPISAMTAVENDEDADFYRRFVRRTSVFVAPVGGIGIDLARVRAAREHPVSTSRAPSVIVLGRLTPEKNLDVIVRAFRKFRVRQPNAGLQFVGSALPGDRPWTVPNLRGVSHLPWVDDPYPLIAGADVMVLASLREGFSMAAAESILVGTPVVAVANRGVRQLLRCGASGVSVVANDADQIADAMATAVRRDSRLPLDERLAEAWSQPAAVSFQKDLIFRALGLAGGPAAHDALPSSKDS